MNERPYASYRDTGDRRFPKVPSHWTVAKIKRGLRLEYGDSLATDHRVDGEVPVFGSNGPVGTHKVANTRAPVIIVGRKGSFGKVAYSDVPVFSIDTTYYMDERHTILDLRWAYYMLQAMRLDDVTQDTGVPGLSREDTYNRIAFWPASKDEQRAIATFLDRKTAQIDALIAAYERLLVLLEEKRQAVITQAVTKGLDPTVPMKDSGLDRIGSIPGHWSVLPIKYLAHVGNGSTPNKDERRYWENGTFPWLTSGCVNQDEVGSAERYVTEVALGECHLPIVSPPAILVGITG